MYLSGDFTNFENRLHQLATSSSDLTSYKTEGSGYLGNWSRNTKIKLSKEVKVKYAQLGQNLTNTFFY